MEQTLGKRISANRKGLGLTQEQLAEKLGVTAQAVSKWENDQSCPDISILPRLAEVFGISTDALLGRPEPEPVVHEAQVVEECEEPDGLHIQNGKWDFRWDGGKRGALRIAVLVLLIGILYLLSQVLKWNVSFWEIAWPSAVLVFGVFGMLHRFSLVNLAFVLIGAFYLADNLIPSGLDFDGGMMFAVIVVLFGIVLLIEALRKKKKPGCHFHYNGKTGRHKQTNSYEAGEDSFDFSASFGENHQFVQLPVLRSGQVSTSFGEYSVDLSGVDAVTEDCCLEVNCSFGETTLQVPRRFRVKPDSSTAFAAFQIDDHPGGEVSGTIRLDASVSFGQLTVRYI